jgi:hypothetical protein
VLERLEIAGHFGDPTRKGTTVACVAHTEAGVYEGTFVTGGKPSMLENSR